MSIIAGVVLGLATVPAVAVQPARPPAAPAAVPPAMTAEQVMAAHRAATSIGPAGCATQAGDEIVVCGRRTDPYALPLYDPTDDDDASRYGGNRVGQMAAIKEAESACAKQGAFCLPPAAMNILRIVSVVANAVGSLDDGD